MKHIFKKLRNHDANRTNGIPPPPSSSSSLSPTSVSDDRTNSVQSPATSASTSYSPNPSNTTPTNNTAASVYSSDQSDYFTSEEEEFQVQLALAISASNSDEFRDDRDKDQIRAATLLSLEPREITSGRDAAELLSQRYWDYNVLDYDEKVVDGFYDLCGLSIDPASQGKMPSLADLQKTRGDPRFEVVIVNRAIDPVLEELHQVAHCFALDCPTTDISLLVPRLAELVTEHMGGPVMDANDILSTWMEKTMDLRSSLHTSILPIGSLNIGLSRHRSLLFKVLADDVGIPCRLVKGSHYTGNDDDAVNIIKLKNEREFLVDLMAAPGTLIPAEILNIKDTSSNAYNPKIGESPRLQTDNSLGVDISRLDVVHKLGNGKTLVENNKPFNGNSSSERKELVTPISSASSGELPISIFNSSNENSTRVALGPGNQSIPSSSSVVGSYSQHKEKQGSLILDVMKENLNVAPYSSDTTKESENLFADLNPFRMAEPRKISAQNRYTNNKANDFQKKRENLASGPGRPPLPLGWKNHSTSNEIPRTKQYEFVEGLLPRKNQEVMNYNTSSLASTSYNSSDKVYPEVHNVNDNDSRVSYPGSTNIGNGHHSGRGDAVLTSSTDQCTRLKEDDQTAKQHIVIQSPDKNLQGDYYIEGEVLRKDTVNNSKELKKSLLDKHDRRNNKYERYMGTKVMSRHLDSSGSQVDTGPSRLDPMLEDVAEWEIPWEDLVIGERIGLGSYGEVFHADWKGTEVAVKKFLDQDFSGDALDEFRSEVRIMRRLRHPNVVLFLGAVTRPPNLSIITEFLPRGSLYRILRRPTGHIDEKHRIKMALDVAKGMNCLHTSIPTVVHRDLKSPNLLVDNNWNVKVSDFGLSRLKHSTFLSSKSTAGTPEWMAPEVLRNEQSNEKCDVYSFGVILWELATLKMPWTGLNPMQVVGAVGFQNRRLEIPKEVDPLVARIILECWQTDPNLRPSFAQLTTTLKPLQRLVVPSHQEQQSGVLL